MKKALKMAALLMALVICAGCFAGCGESASNDEKTLLWYSIGEKQADEESVFAEFNNRVKEELGYEVDIQMIDAGTYAEKMNMIISAGEAYDLCFTSSWSNDFKKNAMNGAYYPLTELLKEFPDLYNSIPEVCWTDATVNGDIYAVPNYQAMTYYEAVAVPKRLAEKYNLDTENTRRLWDMEDYFKQIKENEPDLYPLKPDNFNLHTFVYHETGAPGVAYHNADNNGKVVSLYETPEYLEKLAFARDYYQKGYYRPDVVSAYGEDDNGIVKYGAWRAQAGPGSLATLNEKYDEEIIEIPLVDETFVGGARATMVAIARNSKDPKAALKLLEMINTDADLYNLLYFGIEGKHYEHITEKTVRPISNGGYVTTTGWAFGSQFLSYYIEGQEEDLWDQADRLNREASVAALHGFELDTEPIKNEVSNLSAIEKEYEYLEFGAEDYEAAYKEFIDKLYAGGLQKVIDEVQKQVTAFLAAKE